MSGTLNGGGARCRAAVRVGIALAVGSVLCASAVPAWAEPVDKKFRLSFAIGQYDTDDAISSPSANVLTIRERADNSVSRIVFDPRNDSAVFNDLTVEPALRATIAVQYAVTPILIVEGSVGYQKGDVGDVEVQAQFTRFPIPTEERFAFEFYTLPAGEMEQIPIQFSVLARLRPRFNFNPYFGGGVSYTIVGFEPSAELNELSLIMDQAVGAPVPLQTSDLGIQSFGSAGTFASLEGARVDARDTFAWHLVGGAELNVKKKLVLFLDFRYTFASRSVEIGFNGGDGLGTPVTQGTLFEDQIPPDQGSAVAIQNGGLIDGGRLIPLPSAPSGTNCSTNPTFCEFVLDPDGQLDPGIYYVAGGDIKYGGPSLQIGLRWTF